MFHLGAKSYVAYLCNWIFQALEKKYEERTGLPTPESINTRKIKKAAVGFGKSWVYWNLWDILRFLMRYLYFICLLFYCIFLICASWCMQYFCDEAQNGCQLLLNFGVPMIEALVLSGTSQKCVLWGSSFYWYCFV